MTHNIDLLRDWIRVVVIITAICTTSVPAIYALFPWRSRTIGKVLMMQAIAFAMAMDLSALFTVWTPKDILVIFWIDAIVLTAIAISTASMTCFMGWAYLSNRKAIRLETKQQGL